MGGGGSAPQAPNPAQVSRDQTQSNLTTAEANAALGNTNQNTPYGSLRYDVTGHTDLGNGNLVPNYTATQTLSPEQQKLYNSQTALQQQALDFAPQVLNGVQGAINTKLPDVGALRDQAYNALTARTNQSFDQQTAAQKAQLANQGVAAGSTAYDNAFRPIEQARVDASNQAVANAGNIASQNLSQAQTIRNQPLQDYSTLLGFGGSTTQPTYAPSSQGTVAPTDVSGNYYNSYNGQLQQYQAQQGQQNSLLGGLFGLGGSALGAGIFKYSDMRLKSDIHRVGTANNGLPLYSYQIGGRPEVGVIAQEVAAVKPEAVAMDRDGILMVDYEAALGR